MDADLILRVIFLFVFGLVAAISNYYCNRERQEGGTIACKEEGALILALCMLGGLPLFNLLAVDLEATRQMLQNAGRAVSDVSSAGSAELLVAPDERDGFAFTLR